MKSLITPILTLLLCLLLAAPALPAEQQLDADYAAKIREYTTESHFLTDLVDHLPASEEVPAPDELLGYVIGAPGILTYTKDIYRYLRALDEASPRVSVSTIGHSEEGRETVLVVISEESNLAKLDRYKQITARLGDPRELSEKEAAALIEEGLPIYWISGSIHSPETGSPEMLMELAYRLAVEETPFVQAIRRNSIVMITPVLEVDGHDRQVDLYNYQKAYPDKIPPPLVYWGKYVAHDNNRDGMALSLALSRIVIKTFLQWHPQVLHDLHESVPFLYTSTGMGPYNAWLDPIVINEWQKLAYHEVEEMTKRGVPGVWTHGFYDGWGANYMVVAAQGHNSIGRFYETFGNRGADTKERTVTERHTTRTWYRPNPPLQKLKWSLRNNVNLQQSALLLALNYVARNGPEFLENFYLKSKRSVAKAHNEGPAAWVIPSDDPRPVECAEVVNLLQLHGIEVHRLKNAIEKPKQFPAASFVIRMDQPYSRMADMLLDRQYYNPDDNRPYDDTGWSLGPLRNIATVRVTDASILEASMTLVAEPAKVIGQVSGPASPAGYLINHNTDNTLATFRFRLNKVKMFAAEEAFKAANRQFNTGSFIIKVEGNPRNLRDQIQTAATSLGITVRAVKKLPKVPMHELAVPRIALVHSWLSTQAEGWVRIAFDRLQIPYHYVSDHVIRDTPKLGDRFDVILYGPTRNSAQRLVNGMPMRGEPIPWKGSELTPNFATSPDQTDDVRGGMGLQGLLHLKEFIHDGGLFITIAGNATIPIDFGLIEGVSIVQTRQLKVRGSALEAVISDKGSPITYGYGDKLTIYFNQAPVFRVSLTGGASGRSDTSGGTRPTGRGSATDPDIPQGRPYVAPEKKPKREPGQETPLTPEMRERLRAFIPPPEQQPRIVLRFAKEKELLVSGMLGGGKELANRPAVVDVPSGKGHVLLFANNPMWRHQTQGSFFLLFNAMLNFDHLDVGRKQPPAKKPEAKRSD